jgi:nicotinate-nucleotide adenylyltransferase
MSERIALLGGSFNPPHVGHQMFCLWALSTGRAEQVWLLPTFSHAFGKRLVAFTERVKMCELALGLFDSSRVRVCTIESELERPNRTLNTVQALHARFPHYHFSLLVGADILDQKSSWYRFDELERLVEIVVVGRAGRPSPAVEISLPEVSSSEVRRRLRAGAPVADLVPDAVLAHIRQQGLYQEDAFGQELD